VEVGLTFGAIGDFLSIALLVRDLALALDSVRGSSKAYADLVDNLNIIDRTPQEADRVFRNLPEDDVSRSTAQMIARQMRKCLRQVERDIKYYQPSLVQDGSGNTFKDTVGKIQWRFDEEKDIDRFGLS
jgi:hypothetical protein